MPRLFNQKGLSGRALYLLGGPTAERALVVRRTITGITATLFT